MASNSRNRGLMMKDECSADETQRQVRLFHMSDEKSDNFWEVSLDGTRLTTRWGRIGNTGQTKTKELDSNLHVDKECQKLVRQKLKKGYVEVPSAVSAQTTPSGDDFPLEDSVSEAKTSSESWECVFYRGPLNSEGERDECLQVQTPFESNDNGLGKGLPRCLSPTSKWLLSVHFEDQTWGAIYSNGASGMEIFESSAKRRMEIAVVGFDANKRSWYFFLNRDRRVAVRYELPVEKLDKPEKARFRSTDSDRDLIADCRSGREAVERLCAHYEIDLYGRRLEVTANEPHVVDADGNCVDDLVAHHRSAKGFALRYGEDAAADMLADGIDTLDPQLIRKAASSGARLDVMPDSYNTPLDELLYASTQPDLTDEAAQCARTLVDLGVSIEGESTGSVVLECAGSTLQENEDAIIAKLCVVVPLGAAINAVDQGSGQTALFRSAIMQRLKVLGYLMENGADVAIRDRDGLSVLDWLKSRIAKERSQGDQSTALSYREVLELLTGEDVTQTEIIRPMLAKLLGVTQESITGEARFFDDLRGATKDFRQAILQLEQLFPVPLRPLVSTLSGLVEIDDAGNLTGGSLGQISEFLPAWSMPQTPVRASEIYTVSFVEAVVEKATGPVDILQKTQTPSTKNARKRSFDDDERRQQLLVAGSLRYLFEPLSKSYAWPEAIDSLETLEVYADTGTSKTALTNARKALRSLSISSPDFDALEKALVPNEHLEAVSEIINAIQVRFKLTPEQADDEFGNIHDDLCRQLNGSDFHESWRTDDVKAMAEEMYCTGDFRHIFELADALQQAGCDDANILNHLRDPQQIHVRGCWVVDAVLDGDWTTLDRPLSNSHWPLLLQYPAGAQYDVRRVLERGGGMLPLHDFIAARWDVRAHMQSSYKNDTSSRFQERYDGCAKRYPDLSSEEVESLLSLKNVARDLRAYSFTRRAATGEAGELVRGLTVFERLQQALGEDRLSNILDACAIGEMDSVTELARQFGSVDKKHFERGGDIHGCCVISLIRRDMNVLHKIRPELEKKSQSGWAKTLSSVLLGVIDADPQRVASSLTEFLDAARRTKQKDELNDIVNLLAHGLYRLCEWYDPQLVSEFDVESPYPWDAKFHAWCKAHPDSLPDMNLSDVSPLLHEIAVKRRIPEWLKKLHLTT